MKFNSQLYQGTARLVDFLPKGKGKARNILFSWWQTYPSWDPWLLKDGDLYLLFYLVGNRDAATWWLEGSIHGAISTDMKVWENLGKVLDVNPDIFTRGQFNIIQRYSNQTTAKTASKLRSEPRVTSKHGRSMGVST